MFSKDIEEGWKQLLSRSPHEEQRRYNLIAHLAFHFQLPPPPLRLQSEHCRAFAEMLAYLLMRRDMLILYLL